MNAKTKNEIEKIRKKVTPVLKKHGIPKAVLFGSYVSGDNTQDSDVDIYVDLPKDRQMGFEFFSIAREMEKKLGKEVDLIECTGYDTPIKKNILKDGVVLYEKQQKTA